MDIYKRTSCSLDIYHNKKTVGLVMHSAEKPMTSLRIISLAW